MTRYYTPDEANAALPQVRAIVAGMLQARERIVQAQPDIWPVLEKAVGNGGSERAAAVLADFEAVRRAVQALSALEIEVKDINTGLLDFRARREGREVYLCWRYDEPRVAFWHEIEAGFAGRQPLE